MASKVPWCWPKRSVPVGFLSMPTMGTTAPATLAGALAMGDAEVISATVLMQMINPGAPVFHSIMQAWADPSSGSYVSYPLDAHGRYAPVEMAHHWGMPSLGACYGTDSREAGTWQSGSEVALDAYMVGLTGAEFVTGMGLYAYLHPACIPSRCILDNDIYQKARYYLMSMDINHETLALDTIEAVGPGGHYLAQKHTRKYMRDAMKRGVAHQVGPDGKYRDPREYAIDQTKWILANHHPEPLEAAKASRTRPHPGRRRQGLASRGNRLKNPRRSGRPWDCLNDAEHVNHYDTPAPADHTGLSCAAS